MMTLHNDQNRYSHISQIFHWVMALLFMGMLFVGIFMGDLENSPQKFDLYKIHKSLGLVVLFLFVLRVMWRFTQVQPEPVDTHKAHEKILSRVVVILLMAGFAIMPLSGWLMTSAGGYPYSFFGLFDVPPLIEKNKTIGGIAHEIHEIGGNVIIVAILLHFAGALKHVFLDKDGTLARMLPSFLQRRSGVLAIMLFGVFCLGAIGWVKVNHIMHEIHEEEAMSAPSLKAVMP